jgi:hypothetical protein
VPCACAVELSASDTNAMKIQAARRVIVAGFVMGGFSEL